MMPEKRGSSKYRWVAATSSSNGVGTSVSLSMMAMALRSSLSSTIALNVSLSPELAVESPAEKRRRVWPPGQPIPLSSDEFRVDDAAVPRHVDRVESTDREEPVERRR